MNVSKAEHYRATHPLSFPHKKGDPYGWFVIPSPHFPNKRRYDLFVMVAPTDEEWQHISVSSRMGCPDWDEMCLIKNLFFDEDEVVVQFHPAKKDYINFAENCLHLWRWTKGNFPTPSNILVGPKTI